MATAVRASNETLAVVATAVGAVDFAATRTRAPTAVPLAGDDASSSGSSGGVDAAMLGGAAAAGAVLVLVVVAYVVYRRRTVVACGGGEISAELAPHRRRGGGRTSRRSRPQPGRSSLRWIRTSRRRRRPRVCDVIFSVFS